MIKFHTPPVKKFVQYDGTYTIVTLGDEEKHYDFTLRHTEQENENPVTTVTWIDKEPHGNSRAQINIIKQFLQYGTN